MIYVNGIKLYEDGQGITLSREELMKLKKNRTIKIMKPNMTT